MFEEEKTCFQNKREEVLERQRENGMSLNVNEMKRIETT
jgi:hypothetical protein